MMLSHRHRIHSLSLALIVLTAVSTALYGDDPTPAESPLPVILLTGFQPFGEGRPPNSSWEGIKELDGREWNGYRLRCVELPVEWGAPLSVLDAQFAELRPVAVFSFGQGRPGYFDLEILGRNQRGDAKDNNDAKPPAPKVVESGPGHFYNDSVDVTALVRDLSRRGYNMRVSTDAGQYLCEELNYTLQYERSIGKIEGPVLFCHLPPLEVRYGREIIRVRPDQIQQFVLDLLEDWHREATKVAGTTESSASAIDPAAVDVVHRFRDALAAQDTQTLREVLHPQNMFQSLSTTGLLETVSLANLMDNGLIVRPSTDREYTISGNFSSAESRVVSVVLKTSDVTEERYTLVRQGNDWRIAHLLLLSP
jgi:pyroglutamyl-peptidase